MVRKNAKDHRSKKNPKSAEGYKEERREQNSQRAKQIWVEGKGWARWTSGWQPTDVGSPEQKAN
jgi:hypothetical protein